MVATDTIEGTIDNSFWFHYDLANDILYLRMADCSDVQTYADEQEDGSLLLHNLEDDTVVGLTIVDWWKTYGNGDIPDSLRRLEEEIEPFAQKLAA